MVILFQTTSRNVIKRPLSFMWNVRVLVSTKNTATMISDSFYADCGKKMVEDNESLAL